MGREGSHLEMSPRRIGYFLLLALVLYDFAFSIIYVSGPAYYGDDLAYAELAYGARQGSFVQEGNAMALRVLTVLPIAFFFVIMGVGLLSSAMWGLVSFLLTVVTTFFIAKELYNEYAGLLAATLLSFSPLVLIHSTTVSSDVPMMMFTSLAMLSLLYGTRRNSRKWYFACGMTIYAAALTTPEGGLVGIIAFAYLVVETARKRMTIRRSMYVLYGLLLMFALSCVLNYLTTTPHDPFVTLSYTLGNNGYYSPIGPNAPLANAFNQNLGYYPALMFPYSLIGIIWQDLRAGVFNPIAMWQRVYVLNSSNHAGFIFYFFVAAAAYLVLTRERRAYFTMFWFAIGFLYLEFGPQHIVLSPFSYYMVGKLDRYLLPIMPAVAITVSIALARAWNSAKASARQLVYPFLAVLFLFLLLTGLQTAQWSFELLANERYGLLSVSNYLMALPNSTRIYYSAISNAVVEYMGYENLTRFLQYGDLSNCHELLNNSYVI